MRIGLRFVISFMIIKSMSMLLAGVIRAGLCQKPFSPVLYGILNRACRSDENFHALLSKVLDRLGPQASHDHDLNSLVFELIRWQAATAHVFAYVGQDLHLFGIKIHQRKGRSLAEMLAYSFFHAAVAHGGNTNLHLITTHRYRFSRPLGLCLIPDTARLQDHHGLFCHLFPDLEALASFGLDPCMHGVALMER